MLSVRKKIKIVVLILFMLFFSGCVYYTFSSGSLSNLKTVVIKPVINNTLQYGFESIVETSIKSSFIRDGRLSVKNQKGDIVVSTTVKEFKKAPYDYDTGGNVKTYKVLLTVSLEVAGKGLDKPIYKGDINDWITEDANGFDLEKAKEDVCNKVSMDIIEKIFSYW